MYLPRAFEVTDAAAIQGFITAHPLASLVVPTAQGLEAFTVPLLLDSSEGTHGVLRGHIARANGLWQQASPGSLEALCIFNGPEGYISPNWYPSKAEHHRVVPTWNYSTVHAWAELRFIDDAAWLHNLLARLTHAHETQHQPQQPWAISDAPADFIQKLLGTLIGIELRITRWQGKFKLGQNRSPADQAGAVSGLAAAGNTALAQDMQAAIKPKAM